MVFRWPWSRSLTIAPRNAVQDSGGGVLITTAADLDAYLKDGTTTRSGVSVTTERALAEPTVFGCVRLITGAVATMALDINRRIDERTRVSASDTKLWQLMKRRPNRWQKPSQFRRMLQAHVLLRGNAYCLIVRSRGEIIELIPLHPDRVKTRQLDNLAIIHEYKKPNGGTETFKQGEIFHLFGLTLDGIKGVTPITYARETIGLSLSQQDAGATTFKNGMRAAGFLSHKDKLSAEARANLKASLDEYRAGGESEGKFLILEEGMEPKELSLSAADAQWIESRKFTRTDIAMFFGVPPFMIGDTEKSTSWGSGIEQQKDGFVTFTLDDHLTMWEEGITIDLNSDPAVYARFNRNSLVKGNIKDRWDAYTKALQWGVYSPNKVLELEDENPREGGDIYYPPPNTAGGDKTGNTDTKDDGNDPANNA
jgi:HK97 family phage portal protein